MISIPSWASAPSLLVAMTLTVACGDNGAVQGTESDSDASTGNTPGTTDSTSNPTDGGTATDSSATEGTDSGTASGTDSTPTTTSTDTSATDTSDTTTEGTTQPVTSSTTDETTTTTTGDETSTTTDTSTSDTTTGDTTTDDSTTTTTTGEPPLECGTLPVIYRDLKPMHPDFGCAMWGNSERPGLVQNMLGGDGKPVFNPNPPPAPGGYQGSFTQITSAATFSDWYNAKPDVSMEVPGELVLMEIQPGIWRFESEEFFPLTDQGFGNNVTPNWSNQTYPDRNGSFTTEIHTNFVYEPGQTFSFSGDDDVWIFIDGKLAMDLGGLHGPVEGTIDLDTLGLVPNQTYTLDAFHAERCEAGSNFRIDTSISCFVPM